MEEGPKQSQSAQRRKEKLKELKLKKKLKKKGLLQSDEVLSPSSCL
jgi:hypothetical protein